MALDPEKLDAIIKAGDVAACIAFFRGASEAERKKVAKVAQNHMRELTKRRRYRLGCSPVSPKPRSSRR